MRHQARNGALMFTFPVTALTVVADISEYVATTLPNVPAARRQAVSSAAIAASAGQGYSAESVVDAIALATLWLSPDPLSCFQDSVATTPTAIGQAVGAMLPWVGTVSVTQSTANAKGILTASGIDFDGVNDVLTGTLPQSTVTFTLIASLKSDSLSGSRIPVYVGDANSNGYGLFMSSNNGGLYGGVSFLSNGARSTNTEIQSLTRGSSSSFFVNGVQKTLSNSGASPGFPTSYLTIGGFIGTDFHDGTIADVFVFASEIADRHKVERFVNAYRSLGLF